MKRFFSMIAILFAMNIAMFAQDDVAPPTEITDTLAEEDIPDVSEQRKVTEFMGIPIDGTKREMIKQLKKKGFKRSNIEPEALKGEFNGQEVYVYIHTNKDKKVWRIALTDVVATNEGNIKILFNNLCRLFNSNSKYFPHSEIENYIIPADESIYYNMSIQGKRYDAVFCQCFDANPVLLRFMLQQKKDVESMTEEETDEWYLMFKKYIAYRAYNRVGFTMDKEDYKHKYRIVLYYENGYNQDFGKDL